MLRQPLNCQLRDVRRVALWILLAVVVACSQNGTAQEAKKDDSSSKPVETHKVAKAPFRVEVELKGTFESGQTYEIVLQPEEWTTLIVEKAVQQGAHVKKGEPLIWLRTDELDKQIQELKYAVELSDLSLKQNEHEAALLKLATPLDLKLAERTKQISDENLKYYLEVEEAQSRVDAEYELKGARFSAEFAEEQLKQLEKMYSADDLTEETEEIILKRARVDAERARRELERVERRVDRMLHVDLPRRTDQMKDAAERETLAFERSKASLPNQLSQNAIQLEKLKFDRRKIEERLEKLTKDRQSMVVVSPADGVVYYGECERGKWTNQAENAKRLRRGGVLPSSQVVMTIVEVRPLSVRAELDEKNRSQARVGSTAVVIPTADSEAKLNAKVVGLSAIPVSEGKFDVVFNVDTVDAPEILVPGMTCQVKLTAYENADTVAVPSSAVFSDDSDAKLQYVYVSKPEGKHEKRTVTVGKKSDKQTEVVGGLEVGEEILLKKPVP